jgi:hypothetical protein
MHAVAAFRISDQCSVSPSTPSRHRIRISLTCMHAQTLSFYTYGLYKCIRQPDYILILIQRFCSVTAL